MNYQAIYQQKKASIDQVLNLIESGDRVAVASSVMEPAGILGRLHTIADRVRDVHVYMGVSFQDHEFIGNPQYRDSFVTESSFYSALMRKKHEHRCISHTPGNMHDISRRRNDKRPPRIFFGCATPMDEHGYLRLSLSLQTEPPFIEAADLIVLEVLPDMPVVGGETEIHISDVDYVVEVNRPVPQLARRGVTAEEQEIGRYVASLVNDGDTIQLGIGGVPDAVAQAFRGKRDLGIHTEMLTNSVVDLVEGGIVTNKKKTLHRGKTVTTFIAGDDRLYRYVHNNPSVVVLRGDYVTDPAVVAQNDNMVSINTTLQVDLTGQICSESIGTRQFSGTGGQSDTAQGATNSKYGRSIIALTSTAKNHTVSKIQAVLSPGAVVSLSRNNIDYIVTEYGIAAMRGRSIAERVEALISVAHPDFRAQLRKDAERYQLW